TVAFDLAIDKKIRRSIANSGSRPRNHHRAQNRKSKATSYRDFCRAHEPTVVLSSKLSDRRPRIARASPTCKNCSRLGLNLLDRVGILRRANECGEKRNDQRGLRTVQGNRTCPREQSSHPDLMSSSQASRTSSVDQLLRIR